MNHKLLCDNLVEVLSNKICKIHNSFAKLSYIIIIKEECKDLGCKKRINLNADILRELLTKSYPKSIKILISILV